MDYNLMVNPTSLSQLNKVPIDMTLESMDWLSRANDMDNQRIADLPSLIAHEQRMRPLKETQSDLNNQTSLAQLPGLRAQSNMLGRKDKMEDITFDDTVKGKLRELALKSGEDEIKGLQQQGEKMLYSQNPQERYRGQQILAASKAMYEELVKDQRAKEMEIFKNNLLMQRDAANNASREAIAAQKAAWEREKQGAKTPKDWQEMAVRKDIAMRAAKTAEERQELAAQRDYANEMAAYLRQQAVPAPVINPAVAPNVLQDPRKPMPTDAPSKAENKPVNEDWVSRAMKANPGLTREQVIEQGRQLGKF